LKAAVLMRVWFEAEIARRRSSGELGNDMMGALIRDGVLDDDGVRRTLADVSRQHRYDCNRGRQDRHDAGS